MLEQGNLPAMTKFIDNGFFNDKQHTIASSCCVKVALRIRPQLPMEKNNDCKDCVVQTSTTELSIGNDRLFTFDRTFGQNSNQHDIFDICIKNLILGCFDGFNATVLAYGQTGSGKTYTMGTGNLNGVPLQEYGLVPRAIDMIFDECEKRKSTSDILIKCSFLELHNEDINDLLDPLNNGSQSITIREEKGAISIYGLHEEVVKNATELRDCLNKGTVCRTTSSTLMNATSSRSHAIFTIAIEQHLITDLYKPSDTELMSSPTEGGEEFMTAKFHFVDLAGSERMKKTGATGNTMKEGISINKGLLSLGNVISALTDETRKTFYVPYRDSKLTRILQDSLGGNSRTVMIACVSPADINFDETLNTLKYASRARNIQNKPIINRDPNSTLIAQLKQQVYELQRELSKFRGGNSTPFTDAPVNYKPPKENNEIVEKLNAEIIALKTQVNDSNLKLGKLEISNMILQKERDETLLGMQKSRKYRRTNSDSDIIE